MIGEAQARERRRLSLGPITALVIAVGIGAAPLRAQATPRMPLPPAASAAFERGEYAAALQSVEDALSRCAPSPERPDRCFDLLLVAANLSLRTERLVQAEDYLRRANQLAGSISPEDRVAIAAIDNRAFILQARGRQAEAEQIMRRTLATRRRLFGECSASTGSSYDNLGMNLHQQRRTRAAAPYLRLGLASHRCALGEAHPDTASSYNNVAFNLAALGGPASLVENYLRRAVLAGAASQGDDHPQQIARLRALAFVLEAATGQPVESYALYARVQAAERRRAELGPLSGDGARERELNIVRPHALGQIRAAWLAAQASAPAEKGSR
jgi:tetratricopeptide (TPR) repeat protein